MTNDVESFSISLNRCDMDTAQEVYKVGLPRLLEVLSKHDIQSTFYFTGKMAEILPESLELVKEHGHEIGCHGYDHSPDKAFDLLSYEEQIYELQEAKKAIEPIAGTITSFRAPALRTNKFTVKALEDSGFSTDSSVAPQRFDGPLTFGSKKKLRWILAPRKPFFSSYDSLTKKGDSNILELPISAMMLPFIGTTMRVSPTVTRLLKRYLYMESKMTDKPIVFLFHPNECLDAGSKIITTKRTDNPIEYLFADLIRQRLKLKNLGKKSIKLLDEILESAENYGFQFISSREYRNLFK
ncbi:MAG: polysaccharide deacetylase family protein [Halobacteriota archaeon]|nr:polysaccharide deacetylase family protein [Halobacteriota archaeon]